MLLISFLYKLENSQLDKILLVENLYHLLNNILTGGSLVKDPSQKLGSIDRIL